MSLKSFYPQLDLVRQALQGRRRQVYLVGGAVRDYLLRRPGTDLDFAVDRDSIAVSRQMARRLKAAFVLLDREHGCGRVVKKIDGKTWTFDLSDWRGPSIRKDLAGRDFTINALAVDIFAEDGSMLEVKGARRDLKAGVIRMVSPKVFIEDPVRLLRAFSLQAGLGFKIEAKTLARIKIDAHLISFPAVERIREELFKILASPRAASTLKAMDKIGLLPQVMPQITVMYGVAQGGYHHLDVWRHSLEVLAQLEKISEDTPPRLKVYLQEIIGGDHSRLALLRMAALLHDIGKPETRKKEGNRMTFHGHEHAGERITRLVCKHLKVSVKERYFLENAVRMHLRPGYLANFKRPSPKAVFRFLREARDEAVGLALLAMADQAATRGPLTTAARQKHHAKICQGLICQYFAQKDHKPKPRLLTGHDLIKVFRLKPSPLFGQILAQVEEAVGLGKITTQPEALAYARLQIARHRAKPKR